jgi:acetyl-CoA synthetase
VEGEIVVSVNPRVPGIFKEYYKNPEKTAETLRDGWHHTGDVAWKDEDGYFWYSGRNDDLIKSSGYRISPFEIESVMLEHPAVLECAVTGVPDAVRGQLVKATIILRPGYEPSEALKKEMQIYAKNNTSPYKYPRVIEFVKELPKSISGKIKRVDIRDRDIEIHRQKNGE